MVKGNDGALLDDATSLYLRLCLHLQYRGKMLPDEAAHSPNLHRHRGPCNLYATPPPDLNPEPPCNPTSSFWRSFSKVGGKLWRTRNYDYGKKRMWQSWRGASLKKSTKHPECRGSHVKFGSLSSWWNLLSATQAAFEEERILCSPLQAWKAAEISMKRTGTCSL